MYKRRSLEYYFAGAGFSDLLPPALQMARELHFILEEMIEAICKVADKASMYPPTRNRPAWFAAVFKEKLLEARAEILVLKKNIRLIGFGRHYRRVPLSDSPVFLLGIDGIPAEFKNYFCDYQFKVRISLVPAAG